MQKFNERDEIATVASRWARQYGPDFKQTHSGASRDIYDRLLALNPETATSADVEAIIGNQTWTTLFCEQCQMRKTEGVTFGDTHGSSTMTLCADCISSAHAMLRARAQSEPQSPADIQRAHLQEFGK